MNPTAKPADPGKASEIQSLVVESQRMEKSVNRWNDGYVWFGAVGLLVAFLIFFAQFLIIRRGRQLSTVQTALLAAKDMQLKFDLEQKDNEIAGVNKKAGEANERAGDANKEAAKANEKAGAANERAANLEKEAAKQQERAAGAERELLELKERIKPRRLTDQQAKDFVAILSKLPNTAIKFGHTVGGGDEGFNLLQQIMPLFKESNWKVPERTSEVANRFEIQVIGIGLLIPGPKGSDPNSPAPPELIQLNLFETTLQTAFKAVGMDLQFLRWYPSEDGIPELVVGSKPNP